MTTESEDGDKGKDFKEDLRLELGGDYLFADDFMVDGVWKQFTLTIDKVFAANAVMTKQGRDSKPLNKPVVQFTRSNKKLVLSKTNVRLARMVVGSSRTSEWIGKKLTLYAAGNVPAFGKFTIAIRVRCPEELIPYGIRKHLGIDLTNQPLHTDPQQ